jgi:hypothetical protein
MRSNALGIATVGSPIGGQSYTQRVLATGPIAYWVMGEGAGLVSQDEINSPAQDGAYTGVTLGQPGIGDGNTSPLFDGANDYNNIYTVTLNGVINGAEGSFSCWMRVSGAGVWTDGTVRAGVGIYHTDAVQRIVNISKSSANNTLFFQRFVNAVVKQHTVTPITTTDWFNVFYTWSEAADEVRAFIDGVEQGVALNAIQNWAGNLNTIRTCIGARATTPLDPWDGYLAHAALWNVVLTPAQIATLATV